MSQRQETKILVLRGDQEILRAVLSEQPKETEAPMRLIEALSMWLGTCLEVVLCVDDPYDSSWKLGLDDGFGIGTENKNFEVNIIGRNPRRAGRIYLGNFNELRRIAGQR